MAVFKRVRFFFWLVEGLFKKYYKQILLGLVIGIIVIALLKDVLFAFQRVISRKMEFVGVVGDYTVSTLPTSILSKISYGLTTIDPNGNILPGLADYWEGTTSADTKDFTYTFRLKEGIEWQDGKKVTASDINYNIKSVSFETKGNTIVFHLPSPYAPFLTVVSMPAFKKGLVGVGEYKVGGLSIKAGSFVSLTLTPQNLDTPSIRYKFYKTEPQALTAYKLGEIDELSNLSSIDPDLLKWNNTTVTETTNYNRMVTIFFNTRDPLLGEKGFRQALAYAIPEFPGEQAYSPISKQSWAYTDTVKKYPFDEKQAKKLLDQTKMGTASAELTLHTFPQHLDMAQKIAESWTTMGIKTTVKTESSLPDNYQALLTDYDIPLDPDQYGLWHSLQVGNGGLNVSGYNSPKIDKLLEDGRSTIDQEKRKELYIDFQKRLVDDAPAVFLFYAKSYSIKRK